MTATVTGSIGWESINLGKPVIAFGDAYYKPCDAVGHISDIEQGKDEIKRLINMTEKDVKHSLYAYFHYYHEHGHLVHASNWEKKIEISPMPRKYHVQEISSRLKLSLNL